jgi:hypothetical protein
MQPKRETLFSYTMSVGPENQIALGSQPEGKGIKPLQLLMEWL